MDARRALSRLCGALEDARDDGSALAAVERACDQGFDFAAPHSSWRSPLSWACHKGRSAAAARLIELGAAIEGFGKGEDESPLATACGSGHHGTLECVRILLAAGADPASPFSEGERPLYLD